MVTVLWVRQEAEASVVHTCVIEFPRKAQVKGEMRHQRSQFVLSVEEGLEQQRRVQTSGNSDTEEPTHQSNIPAQTSIMV